MCPKLKNISGRQSMTKKVIPKKQSRHKVQGDSNKNEEKEEKLHFSNVDFALLKGEVTSLKSRLDVVEKNQREFMLLQENSTPDFQTDCQKYNSLDFWVAYWKDLKH